MYNSAQMKKHKKQSALYENFGWLGVGLIVASYGLLAFGVLDSTSTLYHTLVLVGSIGVAAISFIRKVYQPAILNTIFAILAIIALARLLLF